MKTAMVATLLMASSSILAAAQSLPEKETVRNLFLNYLPGNTAFAQPQIDSITVDDRNKLITVACNESTAYIPLSLGDLGEIKSQIAALMPEQYAKYQIVIKADDTDFEQLASDASRTLKRPKEKTKWVIREDMPEAPCGLEDNHIALWQSHGRYFAQGNNAWSWQRPRLYQTCEDLFTQSFVMPFLMPMLENAGAYVMSPRERDVNIAEYIIDNDNAGSAYSEADGASKWSNAPYAGFAHHGGELLSGQNPFKAGTARMVGAAKKNSAKAGWNAEIATPGMYAVYVSYQTLPNSTTAAQYTVNAADGPHKVTVNQKMGGGTWVYIGHYPLNAGLSDLPIVELTNDGVSGKAVVTADAVKIGGGMGNVARTPLKTKDGVAYTPKTSGYPRFTEGSRYWLQWAGAPDSVYSQTHGENDYTDDYTSRGHWVNWLAGGSSVLPERRGLGVPVDLSFAFHSDAGITPNDSVIGTLGIYTTNGRKSYANGTSRLAARDLTDLVMTNIVDDVRAQFNPKWVRRGMWDRNYAESRVPEVPAMLLELLSHQNLADMQYGLDPAFRFVVSRAIYKGMLDYLAKRDGHKAVVQPLPVRGMSITGGIDGKYQLKWAERVDTLEDTATPTYYIIEERVGDALGFKRIAKVADTTYDITVTDNLIHSYRVIAGNDGGVSFPSEVLALRYEPSKPQVMIVNAFTRVSAPDSYDYGAVAGFNDDRDPGVPYICDISYVGKQFEDRRNVKWGKNEIAGMGASRSDYEDKVLAGNTFDFVIVHGQAIANAGYGFVSTSVEAFENEGTDAKVVDLILGNQKEVRPGSGYYGTRYKTFSAPLQQRLREYTAAGGNLLVSGSYIATDLWNNPYSSEEVAEADQKFANEVLGYTWRCGNATPIGRMLGVASIYAMFDAVDVEFYNKRGIECYAATSPDAIGEANENAVAVLSYAHTDFTAGVAYDASTHRALSIGVPFETITTQQQRNTIMSDALKFLNDK